MAVQQNHLKIAIILLQAVANVEARATLSSTVSVLPRVFDISRPDLAAASVYLASYTIENTPIR